MTESDREIADMVAWLCEKGYRVHVGKRYKPRLVRDFPEPEKAAKIRSIIARVT